MTLIRKYRVLISGFMIALYAFIMIPVLAWHHHSPKEKSAAEVSTKGKPPVFSFDTKAQPNQHHCSICSHHYSFYTDDSSIVNTVDLKITDYQFQEYLLQIPEVSPHALSNKGPPALT